MSNSAVYRQTVPANAQDVPQASRERPYPQRSSSIPSSSLVAVEGSRGTTETMLSQGMERLTMTAQPQSNQPINVVLFGEPGVGKSAIVNLIARKNAARVPSGVNGCTLQSTRYDIPIDDMNLRVFETVGLKEPEIGGSGYLEALEKAYEFVNKLGGAGGVHLLLFCIRAAKLTATTQSNYRLFSEVVFQIKVPISFVVTGLEGEVEMEDWWTKNKTLVERYGLKSNGHACITGVTNRTPRQDHNYMESQKRIRALLKSCCLKTSAPLPEPRDWFLSLGTGMQQFVEKYRKPTQTEIMNTLTTRLKLDRKTVQGFLDIMERGNAQQSGRDGTVRPQGAPLANIAHRDSKGEADPPKSNTTPRSRDPDAGRRSDEPQRAGVVEISRSGHALDPGKRDNEPPRRAVAEVGATQSQSRYSNAVGEEDKSGKWDDGARRQEMTAGKAKAEPRKVNTPYGRSEMGVSMEDIRSNFPHDLTGHVTRADKYPFASGGYGDIYRGKFSMSGRSTDVAIKAYKMYLQHDENLPERMRRFHREITVWLKLEHHNVLQLFGTIRDPNMYPDLPAMVCPWVENGSLSGYLERRKDLTVRNRLILVNDVAHGLQYLHSQHVVHGDLSGSNVLVRADGSACIADFGLSTLLSKVIGPAFVTSHRSKGTVRWMAPELLDPGNSYTIPTPRSDVYSFGSIMLQTLTGDVPYHRLSRDEQVIYAMLKGARPDRSNQTAVTNGRWRFIERCWSAGEGRPSSDEIVEFTRRELADSTAFRF